MTIKLQKKTIVAAFDAIVEKRDIDIGEVWLVPFNEGQQHIRLGGVAEAPK